MRRAARGAFALALLLGASPSPAGTPERPRVGLVLSGGSAHGLAHVGVLKVLHELRVPIDVVTGTSMGSISRSRSMSWVRTISTCPRQAMSS